MPKQNVILLAGNMNYQQKNLLATLNTLPETGFVGCVETGEEAINLYPALKPDIILVDVIMNGMTGIETARWIKEQNREIKIILLANEWSEEIFLTAREVGIEAYIIKDSSKEHLLKTLNTITDKKSASFFHSQFRINLN